ncbi:MAG: hypothetical protein AAGD34_00585 [Pseudomonadota bacterium]
MSVEKTATGARQGGPSKRTLYILIISLAAAVVLAFAAYTFVFVEEDGSLTGPLPTVEGTTGTSPAAESPATAAPATANPEATSPTTTSPATTGTDTTSPATTSPATTSPATTDPVQ